MVKIERKWQALEGRQQRNWVMDATEFTKGCRVPEDDRRMYKAVTWP